MKPEKIFKIKPRAEGGWILETVNGIEFSGVVYKTKESAEEFAAKKAKKPWIIELVTGVAVEAEAA